MNTRQDTRERLLEAAEAVFASKGYYEAAVDEIVRRSNTSKGAVYFHFPSKESLFLAVVDHLAGRLIHRVERAVAPVADPGERLQAALSTTLETVTRHRTLASLLFSKGFGMGTPFVQKRQEVYARFARLIRTLLEQVTDPSEGALDLETVAYAWLGAVSEVVVKWLETGRPHPVEEALPTLRALFSHGLGLRGPSPDRPTGDGPGQRATSAGVPAALRTRMAG
ncbi:MAG: TetR/AcrR family transcriptional regulator [Chloroflexi bacterium]|nr:TetR/AcrR family transcriptional regulator [Chloroflexota bacterium]